MTEETFGAIAVALVLAVCGILVVWIGRAGTEHRFDWSWGGHTPENSSPDQWERAPREAGPLMERSGWAMVASGLLGGAALLISEVSGLVVLLGLIGLSLMYMFKSVATGLRILNGAA